MVMGLKTAAHRRPRYDWTLPYVALHTLALIWSATETIRGDFRNTWLIIISLVLLWTWASVMCLLALEVSDQRYRRRQAEYVAEVEAYLALVEQIAAGDVDEVFAQGWAWGLVGRN
jgi:hypothetical protein